jgi:hypothetical protein
MGKTQLLSKQDCLMTTDNHIGWILIAAYEPNLSKNRSNYLYNKPYLRFVST